MAWSTPRTFVANEIISASLLNTHIRDQLNETVPAKAVAAGDIFQATAANAIARLASVDYRMPRVNPTTNLLEYVAGLNLAQAPVFATVSGVNSGTAETNILTQAFTTVGGIVILLAWALVAETKTGAAEAAHTYFLRRDTTQLDTVFELRQQAPTSLVVKTNTSFIHMQTPAAAAYTYKVAALYNAASTSGTPVASARLLIIELAP